MKCAYCGKEEVLPFKCQYCHGLFCAEHRLPENHACSQIEKAKAPKEQAPPFEYKVTYTPPKHLTKLGFSSIEMRHLLISALLVSGVGLSMLGNSLLNAGPLIVGTLVAAFTAAFLIHEIAHKIVAQRYGLWAEFRLILFGAFLTLLSIVIPFPKFIAPGAVMIAGTASKENVGKTAIAGPLTNIIFSAAAFALTFIRLNPILQVSVIIATFNALIAVLNLIPIGILDGWKVFEWNKITWALTFTSSVALLIAILSLYSRFFQF